jgi:hypothetical protein
MSSAERRAWIHEHLYVYGDEDFILIITSALMMLPFVVVGTLLPTVAFLGVGVTSRGWFTGGDFIHRDGHHLPHKIALGPTADEQTVLHECGHSFVESFPLTGETPALSTLGALALRQLGRDWSRSMDKHEQQEERLAYAFAFAWGR